ncbi:MAG: acetyl-CoA carboxylase biotin carboxylase subunit [Firmicutes bacterium]|nr:acetyl-CoA carboxylase biotin carboxylase subunit [Bacillota bacterium]
MKTVLVANRGEIARRILRACRQMGMGTVAIYSDADAGALYVQEADQAVRIGPPPVAQSYLQAASIVQAAKEAGADAIHPGYGLLSENAEFARLCVEAGLTFIGPTPEAIRQMGSKVEARAFAKAAGVPIVPGSVGAVATVSDAVAVAQSIGYPVMLKASAGGGGIGMTVAKDDGELEQAFVTSSKRVAAYFGDSTMYVEKYIENPRHIEIQILADQHGHVASLGERECSIQRRHQKVVEEAPSPGLNEETRTAMGQAAVRLASTLGYVGAGTVEFIASGKEFYFLEMNTRLQVEHPITEEVTSVDIVQWQLRIAQGEALSDDVMNARVRGHAIECRLCAEDPVRFLPSPGTISALELPVGDGIRHEIGVQAGDVITPYYDPMFAKLIVYGKTRDEARRKMLEALEGYVVSGVKTNLPLLITIMNSQAFVQGQTHTGFIAALQAQASS